MKISTSLTSLFESYFAMGTITDPPYDIYSKANSGESFYKDASGDWLDFFNYDAYNISRPSGTISRGILPLLAIRLLSYIPVKVTLTVTATWMAQTWLYLQPILAGRIA